MAQEREHERPGTHPVADNVCRAFTVGEFLAVANSRMFDATGSWRIPIWCRWVADAAYRRPLADDPTGCDEIDADLLSSSAHFARPEMRLIEAAMMTTPSGNDSHA